MKEISVLFIGNSYTFYNAMPTALFQPMAESVGARVRVEAITKGAYRLSRFANPDDEQGARVAAALAEGGRYDFVILQEQSLAPAAKDASSFYGAAAMLIDRVRAVGATPILYSTWGRKDGHDALEKNGWTSGEMTDRLASAYQRVGDETGTAVAHVGLAFREIYTSDCGIELYNPDLSHPSYAGSYLAAAVLVAKVLGVDPTKIAFYGELSESDAKRLLAAAVKGY